MTEEEKTAMTYDVWTDPMDFGVCGPACDEDAGWEKDGARCQNRYNEPGEINER